MYEDDSCTAGNVTGSDKIDKAGHRLPGVGGIKEHAFTARDEADRLETGRRRLSITGADKVGTDLGTPHARNGDSQSAANRLGQVRYFLVQLIDCPADANSYDAGGRPPKVSTALQTGESRSGSGRYDDDLGGTSGGLRLLEDFAEGTYVANRADRIGATKRDDYWPLATAPEFIGTRLHRRGCHLVSALTEQFDLGPEQVVEHEVAGYRCGARATQE